MKKTAVFALLTLSTLMGLPAMAATTTTVTVSSLTTFNKMSGGPLAGISECNIQTGPHSYGTTNFTPTTTASYSFTGVLPSTLADPFLAIYAGSFNPLDPAQNLVGCNDDSGPGFFPRFTSTLNAGTNYVMVATVFNAGAFDGTVSFSTGIIPTITLAPLTAAVGASGQSMVASSDSANPVTYSSSNPAVATIDPATGALTLLSPGTSTITAFQAAEPAPGLYAAGSQTALLTVSSAPAPVASIPTLSEWGMIFMAFIVALFGLGWLRRR